MTQLVLVLTLVLALLGQARPDAVSQNSTAPEIANQQQQQVNATARLLAPGKPAAPYAIDDSSEAPARASDIKSFLFRLLSLNQTSNDQELSSTSQQAQQQQLELRGLLEALRGGNFSSGSEISFGDDHAPGLVNISISNLRNLTTQNSQERLFLEELLADSRHPTATFNVSSVMKDNHRFMGRQPTRSKPQQATTGAGLPTDGSGSGASRVAAVPPIRRTMDVVAENYTARKVADEANVFALKLTNQLNLERLGNENVIQSPFAIYQGLALLLSGAMGDTSRELDRVLLSVQSVYENTKLTHDQDRARLMTSFGDVVRQLQHQATSHFRAQATAAAAAISCNLTEEAGGTGARAELECAAPSGSRAAEGTPLERMDSLRYRGGSEEQHFIVANNLLFSPGAYEISSEFRHTLASYYNNTALTKMEIGSTESVQVVNSWIRQATAGLIPAIMSKRSPFDEFNVMTLLSTSWLAQEWASSFRRVASSLRSSIRLKGQMMAPGGGRGGRLGLRDEPLLEFIDDHKTSHFVDYVRSEPTRHIHNYHTVLNKLWVNVVVVPFRDSNQHLITLTPMQAPPAAAAAPASPAASLNYPSPLSNLTETLNTEVQQQGDHQQQQQQVAGALTETSALSKLLNALALDPRRAMRSLWSTIAPDLITKQTMLSMQLARQRNGSAAAAANDDDEKLALKNLIIPPKTQLSMPLFRIEADSSISAALNHVGVVNAFDPAQADFIGINGHPFNYNKLHLSNVLYKTTFNVDEHGINYDRTIRSLEPMRVLPQKRQKLTPQEAPLERGELVNDVKLNRPFMFLVADTRSKLVLYTGIVRNPAKENSKV